MLLTTVCLTSSLAADVTSIIPDGRLTLLPSFSNDGKGFAFTYSYEDSETNTMRFCIYDEDLQLIKEFVTIPGTPNEYCYQTQERERIPVKANIYNEYRREEALSIDGVSEGLSIEMVLNELNHREPGRWEIGMMEDNVQLTVYRYYAEKEFGKKYPEIFYKQVEGLWYYFEVSYDTEYAPYGEWKDPSTSERLSYPRILDIEIIQIEGGDEGYFELTRGIFNEDFNYVLPEYKKEEIYKEYTYNDTDWVYKKEFGYISKLIGFKVFNSSNKEVAYFDIPEGYICNYDFSPKFLRLGDKRYISIRTESSSEYFDVLYRLDEINKVCPIAIIPITKVSPRAPRRGEVVTVTFDEKTIPLPKTINIISTSGQNVHKVKLSGGQSSLDIDTSRLNQGMYVVTVLTDGNSKEAAKIIVR